MSALGADASVVYGLDETREEARLLASEGFGDETLAKWRSIPLRVSSPVTDVIREGKLLVFETVRDAARAATRSPRTPVKRHGDRSSYCFPLRAAGRMLGAVYVSFFTPRVLDEEASRPRGPSSASARSALDRAQLFEDESGVAPAHRAAAVADGRALGRADAGRGRGRVPRRGALGDRRRRRCVRGRRPRTSQELRTVGWRGYDNDVVEDWLNDPRTGFVPAASALHVRRPVYLDGEDARRHAATRARRPRRSAPATARSRSRRSSSARRRSAWRSSPGATACGSARASGGSSRR